jgi:hypothetical protein
MKLSELSNSQSAKPSSKRQSSSSTTTRCRTLDALHLATCIVLRDSLDVSGMYFVSSDDTLLQAAAAEQFLVRNPLKL